MRQALAFATDAAYRPVPGLVDLEDQRLGELGPDVEGRARGKAGLAIALPDAEPEGHSALRRAVRPDCVTNGLEGRRQPLAARSLSLGHLRPAAATPVHPGHGDADEVAGGDAARDEVVADGDEDLGLVGIQSERDDAGPEHAADVACRAFEGLDRVVRGGPGDQANAG